MGKTTLFSNVTGNIDHGPFVVASPVAIDADFTVKSDRLNVYRQQVDGSYKQWYSGGKVQLSPEEDDSLIIARPGNYKIVGTLTGLGSAQYEELP